MKHEVKFWSCDMCGKRVNDDKDLGRFKFSHEWREGAHSGFSQRAFEVCITCMKAGFLRKLWLRWVAK